ncbi:Unknown protein, partial [Striga hermonthica]
VCTIEQQQSKIRELVRATDCVLSKSDKGEGQIDGKCKESISPSEFSKYFSTVMKYEYELTDYEGPPIFDEYPDDFVEDEGTLVESKGDEVAGEVQKENEEGVLEISLVEEEIAHDSRAPLTRARCCARFAYADFLSRVLALTQHSYAHADWAIRVFPALARYRAPIAAAAHIPRVLATSASAAHVSHPRAARAVVPCLARRLQRPSVPILYRASPCTRCTARPNRLRGLIAPAYARCRPRAAISRRRSFRCTPSYVATHPCINSTPRPITRIKVRCAFFARACTLVANRLQVFPRFLKLSRRPWVPSIQPNAITSSPNPTILHSTLTSPSNHDLANSPFPRTRLAPTLLFFSLCLAFPSSSLGLASPRL